MSLKIKTHKDCPRCGANFKLYKTTDKHCQKCAIEIAKSKATKPRQPINRISKKRAAEKPQYDKERIDFLALPENKYCKIQGPTCTNIATTIEHTRGRNGYADEEKRILEITLYLDKDFWLPACCNCNLELENNPELSRQFQLSKIHGGKKEPKQ